MAGCTRFAPMAWSIALLTTSKALALVSKHAARAASVVLVVVLVLVVVMVFSKMVVENCGQSFAQPREVPRV